jgi:ankyrin repeat protein/response regulator RpfG family c-di-GMP phosphodiesterase
MSKNILLVESRAKQMVVTSLNLNIYLDSLVQIISNTNELIEALENSSDIDLVIISDGFSQSDSIPEITNEIEKLSNTIPHLVIGEKEEQILLDDSLVVRPLLKESARILNLTPKMMAEKDFGEYFELPSTLIHFLSYAPCDIFISQNGLHYDQVYSRREHINHEVKVDMKSVTSMYVRSSERLEFVNSLTEQNREDFLNEEVVNERFVKEVKRIHNDMDKVSGLLSCGVDSEKITEISSNAIKAMVALAEEDIVIKDLINRLNESESNFRYKHSQLITFIGLAVLLELDRSEQEMEDFASAAFFHDISLKDDELASTRNNKSLLLNDFTMEQMDQIRNHAFDASEVLKRLNSVNEKTMEIIIQHHGSKDGLGFSDSLRGISFLSKVFVIVEHWVHIQLFEEETEQRDLSKYKGGFEKHYPGKNEAKIIDALFQIEAKELIESVTEDLTQEIINIKGAYDIEEDISLVKGLTEEDETETTVSGVTDHILEESQLVSGDGADQEDKSKTVVNGEAKDLADKSKTILNGESQDLADNSKTVIKGTDGPTEEDNYVLSTSSDDSNELLEEEPIEESSDEPDEVPRKSSINAEMLINTYISKFSEIKAEVGGDWAFSKFLSTLMALDHPLSQAPFYGAIHSLGEELSKCLEEGVELADFSSKIKTLSKDIKESFEDEILNTINNRDKLGRTKLMIAISTSNLEIYNYICSFDPDFKLTDSSGKSALHFSCMCNNVEIAQSVYHANTSALNKSDSKKRTALFYAVNSNNLEIVNFLISAGARPRMVADNGVSTSMLACHNGNLEILEALVGNGEPLDVLDHKYKSCYQYAKQKKHKKILIYLKGKGIEK